MTDSAPIFFEIQRCIHEIAARVGADVVSWRQDPQDPRHFCITARLQVLPASAAPIQLELLVPSLRTQL